MNLRSAVRFLLALPLLLLIGWTPAAAQQERGVALVLGIDGAIGPATAEYFENGLERAVEEGAEVLVLRMDTPGGLDSSMRDIIRGILASPVPVVSYVAPRGARAASAGTYILYASHVAAMAPGTNLGAATPVQIGGGPQPLPDMDEGEDGDGDGEEEAPADAMRAKVINDAAAYIRSLAELRGRNAEWAEAAVRRAASLSSTEALDKNVIDLMAADIPSLLSAIDGREVTIGRDDRVTIDTADIEVVTVEPDWRIELLSLITDPNIAFVLMMIGIYGLIFEFANPGAIFPGVIGAICLMLALYALNVLPVNYAGLALIVLGIGFIVAEFFVPSFGALGVGGIVALGIGAAILFDTDVPGFEIALTTIASVMALMGLALLMLAWFVVRAHRRPVAIGERSMVGEAGRVEDWLDGQGYVRIGGELWHGRARHALRPGQKVRVVDIDGLTLDVEPEERKEPR